MSRPDTQTLRATALLAAAGFCSAATMRICDPLIPELARSFDTTTGHAAQTVMAFTLAYGLLQLVYGLLGDRYGKYALITVATFVSAAASLATAFAPGLGWLIALRAIAGAAAAGIIPLSMAWLGDTVAYGSRQSALARMLTGTIAGLMAGQILGGVFADTIGWRWAFVLIAMLFLGTAAGLASALRSNERTRKPAPPADSPPGPTSALGDIRTVFGVKWARVILIVVFIEGVAVFGALAFFPTYLHQHYGVALTTAGITVALFGAGGLLYALAVAQLLRRLREGGMAIAGTMLLCTALILLVIGTQWLLAAAAIALAGFGYYMLHNTLQTNATQMAPTVRGTALALFASSLFVGQSVGVALAGAAYDSVGPTTIFLTGALALPLLGIGFARARRQR